MQEFQRMTYEISRCYTLDHENVAKDLSDKIDGFRRSKSLKDLAACSSLFDPLLHGIDDWKYLRQIEAFFKKNRCFSDRKNLHQGAMLSFRESEAQCMATNARITEFVLGNDLTIEDRNLLFKARQWIARVLGDFPSFRERLPSLVRVTSGASATRKRKDSIPQLKLSLKPYCSSKAVDLVKEVYRSFGFEKCRPRVCDSNRIELVPKDWRKDRTIACEPEANCALQLAFDEYAKKRLKRHGIDLRNQSISKERAKLGSIDGSFATVDFSSASDTVAYNLVAWFLPTPWFEFLDSVRSPQFRGVIFGSGEYEKFSSMGNGSTFTLETLVFASICYACGSRRFLVYGDDVIIETELYNQFVRIAVLLGFTVNLEKSFASGPFRESCGGEYFNGVDVTPVVIRTIDERKAQLCHLHNSLSVLTSPFEWLGWYLEEMRKHFSLPFAPFNENTMSGVWIEPLHARKLGLLRRRSVTRKGPVLDYYKAYVPETKSRSFARSWRGYYLWFLSRNNQVSWDTPWDNCKWADRSATETSTVTIFEHNYVRKWVSWQKPRESAPLYAICFQQMWLV